MIALIILQLKNLTITIAIEKYLLTTITKHMYQSRLSQRQKQSLHPKIIQHKSRETKFKAYTK
jgi:hypothetical protein